MTTPGTTSSPTIEATFGPEFTRELHGLALVLLINTMAERRDGYLMVPEGIWGSGVLGITDRLNDIAKARLRTAN